MLLKSSVETKNVLPGMSSLINCIREQTKHYEKSNVAYVQILSKRPDSHATFIKVLGELQKTVIQQKHLVVLSDAKTYNLLQKVKYENLRWLAQYLSFMGIGTFCSTIRRLS